MTNQQDNNTPLLREKTSTKSGEWFRHDYHSRNDKKISQLRMLHGARGYGLYLMIVEMIYENGGGLDLQSPTDLKALEWELREENIKEFIDDLVKIGLLRDCTDGKGIFISGRVLDELRVRTEKSIAAQKAVEVREARRSSPKKRSIIGRSSDDDPIQDNTIQTIQTNNTVQEIQIPAYAVGKNKIGQNVFVSTEQYSKLRAKYAESGLGEDYLKRAVDILDGYYAKRVGPKSTKTNRDQYTDDYLVLIGWPLKNVIDEAASAARLKNSRNVGNAGASGKPQQPQPQPLKGTVGQVLSSITGAR